MHLSRWLAALLLITPLASTAACGPDTLSADKGKHAILAVIATMEGAWNRGDFPGYMKGFLNPDVVFVSRGHIQSDWQGTLDHYVRDYGTNDGTRGELHFHDICVQMLAPDAAQLISHYDLAHPDRIEHGVNTRLMRKIKGHWLIALNHVSNSEPTNAAPSIQVKKIILVGDSTTAVQSGWGPSFCAYHVSSFGTCVNLARGGRSTLSYRAEGSWDVALNEMRVPGYGEVYVLIQFGHNDQPGKPGRSTDLAHEFPDNYRRYVTEARAAGAIPVLVTPLTRRMFKDGKLQNDLEPWADTIRQIAADMHVPLIDLNARSAELVQSMGAAKASELAQVPPSAEVLAAAQSGTTIAANSGAAPPTEVTESLLTPVKYAFDYTHLGRQGADLFSKMVAEELVKAVPALKPIITN